MTQRTPFSKILIANRGEIALRIMRSAKAAGYRTVAVYSTADAGAPHVAQADQAVSIGGALPAQSYLNIEALIAAARATGADAVHPGYGFLAENVAFAQACISAGLVFIGPTPVAITAMGNKAGAKRIMQAAGVPCVPGYQSPDGEVQDAATLATEAARIGWPVMIKAVAGGGGRGMRLVRNAAEFALALRSAQSEAHNAFGDDTVILERAIAEPRHIEIQVFADRYGHAVHLGERDCSVQRRHQKLIEEAPSPAVDAVLRARMGAVAVAAVKAIGYEGAGTLEFLLDPQGQFYFMEMNTRLQVEHPVTEAITGLDLVAMQLQVAAGEPLALKQEDVRFEGHAIEVRLCAEDAGQDFMPQSGTLALWQPAAGLRTEHALASGSVITPFYDSMVAKLVAHGRTREEARRRLLAGLQDTVALGLTTNQSFLARCVAHPVFAQGAATTAFIEQHRGELLAVDEEAQARAAAIAAVLLIETAPGLAPGPGDCGVAQRTEPRLVRRLPTQQRMLIGGHSHEAQVQELGWANDPSNPSAALPVRARYSVGMGANSGTGGGTDKSTNNGVGGNVRSNAAPYAIELLALAAHGAQIRCDGVQETVAWVRDGATLHFTLAGLPHTALDTTCAATAKKGAAHSDGRVRASMNGRVVAVQVQCGQRVTAGQALLTLEAMKMEHIHAAPVAGMVQALPVNVGEQVAAGRVVVEIAPDTEAPR
jgi:geranyl-CoA carboxylase alpha subunit